jgi:hypothetical protein
MESKTIIWLEPHQCKLESAAKRDNWSTAFAFLLFDTGHWPTQWPVLVGWGHRWPVTIDQRSYRIVLAAQDADIRIPVLWYPECPDIGELSSATLPPNRYNQIWPG